MLDLAQGKNDLKTWCILNNRLDLIEQYSSKNEIKITNITYKSGKKVLWELPYDDPITQKHFNFEWYDTPDNRVRRNSGCPYLRSSHKKLFYGFNDAETWCKVNNRYDLIEQYSSKNAIKLKDLLITSKYLAIWVLHYTDECTGKTFDFEWSMTIADRFIKGFNCPYLSSKYVYYGFNDFETYCKDNNLDLLDDWDYDNNLIKPSEISKCSNKLVYWKCHKCGNPWSSKLCNRTNLSRGCPHCNNIGTSFPEQAILYYIGNYFNVYSRYKFKGVELDLYIPKLRLAIEYDGFVFHSSIKAKKRDSSKNIFCSDNKITLIRIRELGCPDIDDCITYSVDSSGYAKLDYSSLNNVIKSLLNNLGISNFTDIDIKRDRFLILSKYKSYISNPSILETNPEIAMEWNYEKNSNLLPEYFTHGSNTKVWWRCSTCSYEWEAVIAIRCDAKTGCPVCNHYLTVTGLNDLLTEEPKLVKEFWDFDRNKISPSKVMKSNNNNYWWICHNCGHSWKRRLNQMLSIRTCPVCSRKQRHDKQIKIVLNLDTDDVFTSDELIKLYGNSTYSHIRDVCSNKRKTAMGYRWKFLNNSYIQQDKTLKIYSISSNRIGIIDTSDNVIDYLSFNELLELVKNYDLYIDGIYYALKQK